MGGDRPGRRPPERRRGVTARVVRVVPDVPTFAVDDGFSYLLPDALDADVGSIVRVPLGGRTVRGWIVGRDAQPPEGAREVRRVSGSMPVFGPAQLGVARWLAQHYVAPLATVLRSFTPPNLPTRVPREESPLVPIRTRQHFVDGREAIEELGSGAHNALVVVPTAAEVDAVAGRLAATGRRIVPVGPDDPAKAVTKAWSVARLEDDLIVVGTGRVATWWVRDLGAVVLWDEQRRSHKERQSPTFHSRTILSQRSRAEGPRMLTTGAVPSLDVTSIGTPVSATGRRWGRVEVVDRFEEPPGRGVLSDRVKAALHHIVNEGGSAIVFTHRRGYAPAFRCVACRALRRCPGCGTAATSAAICRRCGARLEACADCGGGSFEPLGAGEGRLRDLVARLVGAEHVVEPGAARGIAIVTERDLVRLGSVDLAIVIDADALILGPHFRSSESALALLARVASFVRGGSGSRLMVQTAEPDHEVIDALRTGDPSAFLTAESARREAAGYPPFGDLIALEIRGEGDLLDEERSALQGHGALVFGPLSVSSGTRWLIQGRDLGAAKRALRGVLRRLRDGGAAVRVDVDPLDV